MIRIGKFFFLILLLSCVDKRESYYILLTGEKIHTKSIKDFGRGKVILFSQYEGFVYYSNDKIFGNPILMPEGAEREISKNVISESRIIDMCDRPISKIIYRIKANSVKDFDRILKQLKILYSDCYFKETDFYTYLIVNKSEERICYLQYFLTNQVVILELQALKY